MRTDIANKITSQKGETLTETLIALLISSIAMVMLAGAITATSHVVDTGQEKMKSYYDANNAMIENSGTSDSGAFTLKDTTGASSRDIKTYNVTAYKNTEFSGHTVTLYNK